MVKSKKMSKTSIAVIVLALLLVLSMVMGITGAWFTSKSSTSSAGQTLKFGSITVTLTADEHNGVYHLDKDGGQDGYDNPFTAANGENGEYLLVAGDYVVQKFTLAVEHDVPVWYLLTDENNKAYKINASGNLEQIFNNQAVEWTSADDLYLDYSFAVATNLDYQGIITVNGANITITKGGTIDQGGVYTLHAIQKTNIGAAEAYAEMGAAHYVEPSIQP